MLSQGVVRHLALLAALLLPLAPGLSHADALLRASVESLRDAESAYLEGTFLASGELLADFYAARGYQSAWPAGRGARELLAAAEASPEHGLVAEDFNLKTLRLLAQPGALTGLSDAERISADLRLSDALLRYVHHIRFGRLDPKLVNPAWTYRNGVPAESLVAGMESVVGSQDLAASLDALAPKPFFYEALRQVLLEAQGESDRRTFAPIPPGPSLVKGERDPRVAQVRERLAALGNIKAAPDATDDPALYDADLYRAVIAFQRRQGLGADGIVGPATITALEHPTKSASMDKVRINLERMRWFYSDLPPDYVLVDVAGFMAHVVRGGSIHHSTRVVVGTTEQQTPSFRDEMEHLVFNPTWTVPESIEKKFRGVPGGYKRVKSGGRYYLVQQPGPRNALGQVKFMFPNGHAIYLHDTPSKGLFGNSVRTYSHGCIRVQNPLKLAEVILNEPAWNQSAIKRVVSSSKTRHVLLDDHLPVLLYYLTALADEKGTLSVRRDVYGRDRALLNAYKGPASPLRIAFPKPVTLPQPADGAVQSAKSTKKAAGSVPERKPKPASVPGVSASTTLTLNLAVQANPPRGVLSADNIRAPALEADAGSANTPR